MNSNNPGGELAGDRAHNMAMIMLRVERERQVQKWGVQRHPDGTGTKVAGTIAQQWKTVCDIKNALENDDWATIAAEEFFEAMAETDKAKILEEVTQYTAVGLAWMEDLIAQKQRGEF